MQRAGKKRLSVDIPIPLYDQLKLIVERRNITITRLIIKLIIEAMHKERDLE